MTLKLINNKIVFTPNFPDIESSLLETYDTILRGNIISHLIIIQAEVMIPFFN